MAGIVEIRWHGRGGQGAVLASRILAMACFLEGKWSQAFPFFGAERRGAPVMAFTRVSDRPVRLRSQIYSPDALVFLDPMFLSLPAALDGLKPEGVLVANWSGHPRDIKAKASKIATVDATDIAVKLGLSVASMTIPNTAMVGSLIKVTGLVDLGSTKGALRELMTEKLVEVNEKALELGYERTQVHDLS